MMNGMRVLPLVFLSVALFAQTDQKTNKENMVRDRGQTRVQDNRETMTRGRVGSQEMMPQNELTLGGVLVDASCEDRSAANLRAHPVPLAAQLPAQPSTAQQNNPPKQGSVTAGGITVDAATIERERADIMAHQVPDMLTRQEDPTCAITASTRGYALLMDNGRLLNLDEGGNTLATAGVLADARGRAMLNGQAPGIKPRAVVKGWVYGDRVVVDTIPKLASQ